MRVLKIQSKTLLNMKMVVKYLNFVFHIEVKTKSYYKSLNFVFQFIKNMKWHFGYTDCLAYQCSFVRLYLFPFAFLIICIETFGFRRLFCVLFAFLIICIVKLLVFVDCFVTSF